MSIAMDNVWGCVAQVLRLFNWLEGGLLQLR